MTASGAIEIKRDDLTSTTVTRLIAALNAELSRQYPEPGATHFRLDPGEVGEGRGAFFVAYAGDTPVGCGAIRRIDAHTAEIKRMYVAPAVRGRGVGHRVLTELEAEARRLGAARLVLETGERAHEAMKLYTRAGFVRIPCFGEYAASPLSVCMAKDL
jgi:putative acetyltransferase